LQGWFLGGFKMESSVAGLTPTRVQSFQDAVWTVNWQKPESSIVWTNGKTNDDHGWITKLQAKLR